MADDKKPHLCFEVSTGTGGALYCHCDCGVVISAGAAAPDMLINKFVKHVLGATDDQLEVGDAEDEDDEPD
jgi:hypothetical protein